MFRPSFSSFFCFSFFSPLKLKHDTLVIENNPLLARWNNVSYAQRRRFPRSRDSLGHLLLQAESQGKASVATEEEEVEEEEVKTYEASVLISALTADGG